MPDRCGPAEPPVVPAAGILTDIAGTLALSALGDPCLTEPRCGAVIDAVTCRRTDPEACAIQGVPVCAQSELPGTAPEDPKPRHARPPDIGPGVAALARAALSAIRGGS